MLRSSLPLLLLALTGCSPLVVDFKDPAVPVDDTGPGPEAIGPDIAVDPLTLDFGVVLVGETNTLEVVITNEGDATLVGGVELSGSGAFSVDYTTFGLDPDVSQVVTVTFAAASDGAFEGELSLTSNDPDEPSVRVTLVGEAGRDGDGDGYAGSDDCDDADASVNPGASETWYDGIDQDCSGTSDYDQDGDGADAEAYGGDDCDDTDATMGPDAEETWYDGIDQDCDERSDYDQDRDGRDAAEHGGDDCDDTNADAYPGHEEVLANGVDDDCDGEVDEELSSVDTDGDGYSEVDGDCLEGDATVNPGATETWYDGVDQDCSGTSDYDQDGDGSELGDDCEDTDAAVNPGATDTWYDGVDQDCSGGSDYDQDGDGADASAYGGTDCDDLDASVNTDAVESWYDGVDQDCSGTSDYDADADGYDAAAYGGADCDDLAATTNPGASESWYDGVDQDCSGGSDYDQDADGYDASAYGGTDCDDVDATVNTGATEAWYDGVDQDCSGTGDYDQDGDGYDDAAYGGTDCDDLDAAVNTGATETWYDGVDQDCSYGSDYDQDADGEEATAYGGFDCDDLDAAVNTDAAETWYDGVDQDCSGTSDYDQDADGYDATAYGGADCADTDASRSPGATEVCDDVDQDCDGVADDGVATSTWYADVDGDGYGDAASATTDCAAPAGYVADATDCDDATATTNPGAPELSYDVTDNDCDAIQDEMLAESESGWTVLGERSSDRLGSGGVYGTADLDGDGYPELVIGAGAANTAITTDTGIVVFHDVGTAGLDVDATSGWYTLYGNSSDDYLGSAFAVIGDVDGGGATEIVIGAYQNDIDQTDDGTVYLLDVGGESGWDLTSSIADGAIYGDATSSYTGYALAVGDFDGDGENEVASGAPGEESGKGQVYVSFLADGFDTDTIDNDESQFWVRGVANNDHLGYAVAMGEVTGDGYDDLVACSPDDDDGGSGSGTCWVVVGSATRDTATNVQGSTVSSVDAAVVTGGAASDQLGSNPQAISIGDFDGNGLDDLALGMPGYDGYATDGGAVLIYQNGTLSGSETSATAGWLVRGDGALGTAVSMTGDVTGDGIVDLLAGATTAGASDEGVVYLLEGGIATGTWTLPTSQYASWTGKASGDQFGAAISGLRDLDGDGVLDFAVAATSNDDGATDAGKVYVLPAYP